MFTKKYSVQKEDYANAGKVSSNVKSTLKELGIDAQILRRISIACYEAEINMIIHSYGGEIILEINKDGIVYLSFNDQGPGIEDIDKALTPGYSTASKQAREFGFGAGMGLPNIKRVSDTFDITTSKQGTNLRIGFKI
ncbi:MAG: ATP-binding protein [Traorella sp.]